MHRAIRSVVIIGFNRQHGSRWMQSAEAQQLRIENAYPRQLPIGQTTVVNAVLANPNAVQAAEVSPSQGVTVSGISRGDSFRGRSRGGPSPSTSQRTLRQASGRSCCSCRRDARYRRL